MKLAMTRLDGCNSGLEPITDKRYVPDGVKSCYGCSYTTDNEGNYCPSTSVCHSPCKMNEQTCPGEMDMNGCKEQDTCHARQRDSSGNLCHFQCPGTCMDGEILCKGPNVMMGYYKNQDLTDEVIKNGYFHTF